MGSFLKVYQYLIFFGKVVYILKIFFNVLPIAHREFWLRNDKSIIYFQIFNIMCKNVRKTCRNSKKKFCTLSFFVNPSQVKWHPLKQTKTKNKHHFFIPTFKVMQLCFFDQNYSFTLKVLKTESIFGWAMIWNIACSICNPSYHGSAKDKLGF